MSTMRGGFAIFVAAVASSYIGCARPSASEHSTTIPSATTTAEPRDATADETKPPSSISPPETLDEAHTRLLQTLPANVIQEMRDGTEADMVRYHHGLGTGLRNGWGLWTGGPLAKYFNAMGIKHPDDMSAIILDTFWCKLHGQPFRLEERVAFYQAFWRSQQAPTPRRTR
jgi:hypothetical protein